MNSADQEILRIVQELKTQRDDALATVAAMMEIVEWASHQGPYVEESTYEKAHCPGCGAGFGVLGEFDWDEEVAELEHRPGCPVIKAQALVTNKNISSQNGD